MAMCLNAVWQKTTPFAADHAVSTLLPFGSLGGAKDIKTFRKPSHHHRDLGHIRRDRPP